MQIMRPSDGGSRGDATQETQRKRKHRQSIAELPKRGSPTGKGARTHVTKQKADAKRREQKESPEERPAVLNADAKIDPVLRNRGDVTEVTH
jgi:hypothetical protein